mgnify:CR=1 FL=1
MGEWVGSTGDRERAALAWVETITLPAETGAPEDIYERARGCFTERELVDLTTAAITINDWNRLAVGFRTLSGT